MARLTRACPLLAAADPAAAAAWYRDRLGFEIQSTYPDEGYAIVRRDDIELHVWRCDDRRIAENTSAYLRVDDIDGLHSQMGAAAEGGRISAVQDRAWGMREFYVWDPDGNLLRFGEPVAAIQARALESRDLPKEFEQLSPAEQNRQIEVAAAAIREGRL